MAVGSADSGVCLAELIAALSLGTDLGLGQPMEHVLRMCVLALALAERSDLDESERSVVYYVALLAWVGCCADSFEQARWFGDDIAARADYYPTDLVGMNKARFVMHHVGAGEAPVRRARTAIEFVVSGRSAIETMRGTHCIIAGDLAGRLGLGERVRVALGEVFERWDGRGDPGQLAGTAISRPVRLVQLADVVEVFHREGGIDAAVAVARERSGAQFDPGGGGVLLRGGPRVACFAGGHDELERGDRVEENLNPIGRAYYAFSTLLCTPASLSQEVGLALGAQAGEARIRDVVEKGGFTRFRRVAETPFNLVFEARP